MSFKSVILIEKSIVDYLFVLQCCKEMAYKEGKQLNSMIIDMNYTLQKVPSISDFLRPRFYQLQTIVDVSGLEVS